MSWTRLWYNLTDPATPWWMSVSTWVVTSLFLLLTVLMMFGGEGFAAGVALFIFGLILVPLFVLVALFRIGELRRCQYATNRWFAGLCPVCKYPRGDDTGDICPECGRDMKEQATLAAMRMGRKLEELRDSQLNVSARRGSR